MRLRYSKIDNWPALAWLASAKRRSDEVMVLHGPRVETRHEWFCEAVWDGDFASGDFDQTDLVFGSGGRVREGEVVFVSAGTTVDRLHSFEDTRGVWVSNSLPCLTLALDACVDPAYSSYVEDFRSIIEGLTRYKQDLQTSAGPVKLTYFNNLRWDTQNLVEMEKPFLKRDLFSFVEYRNFLLTSLGRIVDNMASGDRSQCYQLLGTISSGYDSPAIAVLARELGLSEVIGFDKRWTGEPDSGATIARQLGIDFISVSGDAWKGIALAPVPFLAVDANGGDVAYCGAEDTLKGRVLLTGYESGKVWKKRLTEPNDHNITRPDQSGLSLSEYRLWADCLHVPLPFMGIRQVEDINTIGRSEEMAAWDMGGNYNKPIPRRIIEEAGVPRDMFAVKKLGVSVRLSSPDVLRSARIRDDYYEWLREHTAVWLKSGRLPPQTVSALARPLQPAAGSLARGVRRAERRLKIGTDIGRRLKLFATRDYVYKFLFPWALRRAQSRYESGLNYRKTCPN